MESFRIIPLAAALMFLFIGATDATCPAGYKDCDKDYKSNRCEVNILTDTKNCGNCGIKCPAYPYAIATCKAGKCLSTCKPGWKNCNKKWSDGCETDVGKDVHNCGACGKQCNGVPYASTHCSNHKCMYTCKAGWKNCNNNWTDGCETDVGKDLNNCGGCGVKCDLDVPYASTKCSNSRCEYTCSAGWEDCNKDMKDGCEIDVGGNVDNCGGCGLTCKEVLYATAVCSGGKCEYTCEPGWANCNEDWEDGCETEVNADVNNCGECGNVCPEPKFWGGEAKCSDGVCEKKWCIKGWKYSDKKKCCVEDWWPFGSGDDGDK